MEKDTHTLSHKDDEAALSASILATEASINAKMKQITEEVRSEVGVVVDKVHAIKDAYKEAKDAVNINKRVAESPFKMLAISAVVGLFAGGILRRKSSPRVIHTAPAHVGPGMLTVLAVGILRPIISDIVHEFAHRTLTQRKQGDTHDSMNGSGARSAQFTH